MDQVAFSTQPMISRNALGSKRTDQLLLKMVKRVPKSVTLLTGNRNLVQETKSIEYNSW